MNDRPRNYATVISNKVTELIREELKAVPAEQRVAVVDHVLNSLGIEWSMKKTMARRVEK